MLSRIPLSIIKPYGSDRVIERGSVLALFVAGNNLKTLLTPQQMDRVERGDFSLQDDRDALVADWALPRLITLNPQYPLRENPDLIRPGWRLNVG